MRLMSAAGIAATLTLATVPMSAQDNNAQDAQGGQGGRRRNRGGGQGAPDGGNFDPAAMRQRMSERMKEQFGVKDDAEWKLISERVEKVTDARREVGGRGMFGMMGRGGPGGPGGAPGGAPGADAAGGGRRGGGFGGTTSPEAEALQKAIEANAPADEIKTKLAKYRASQKDKQAKLDKAQEELREVLSSKQEAQAVLMGLLK
ncbi:MAG: hypothetical protein DVB31_05135 [Verrucomicrobia bacterium]|nr:MAG: hypothetical protein DVB31_05135 [Verrucomicrobiota bacterium]